MELLCRNGAINAAEGSDHATAGGGGYQSSLSASAVPFWPPIVPCQDAETAPRDLCNYIRSCQEHQLQGLEENKDFAKRTSSGDGGDGC